MGSHVETKTSKHQQYQFPLSPPSSGSVTALSSPRLATLYPEDPDIVERLLTSAAVIHPPHLRASSTSEPHATDSEGYATERSTPRHTPRKDVARKVNNRSLTLPSSSLSGTTNSPSKTARPLSRRSNSSCSSSSSSSPATHDHVPSASGIGRKVAATLQLFKETTGPSEDSQSVDVPSRSEPPSASSRRVASSSNISNVAEAQFEFVKRSEWPDRETAAIRREKSTTTLERVRAREPLAARDADDWPAKDRKSSIRDAATDLAQWRNDVISKQDTGRGRRRERIDDELVFDGFPVSNNNTLRELPSPFTRPNSRAYPPSPSPSRSPASRVSPVYTRPIESHSRSSTHSRASLPDLSIPSDPHPVSQSSTPTQTQPQFLFPQSAPLSPQGSTSFSPWSTDDDESTWETASNSTTTSTTSAHSYSYSPPRHGLSSYLRIPNDEEPDDDPFIYMKEDQKETEPRASSLERAKLDEFADAPLDDLHGQLPHIPLRPFRNQVGGHSAIYKFTRRAVCKVRMVYSFPDSVSDLLCLMAISFVLVSRLSLARIFSMNRSNERLLHCLVSFQDI
ncbi:hypothetical protein BD779DRAFT_361685 [Infundibulicybe gibba]|nr:hypothetical protein BD779DRAFT_361685 [Infundibulicybe gibba]